MKRVLLVLALTALLVMAAHSMALGVALTHFTVSDTGYWSGGFFYTSFNQVKTDTWFTITPEKPLWVAGVDLAAGYDRVGFGLYQNGQTFIEGSSGSNPIDSWTSVRGSYLFSNGIFAGLDYAPDTYYDVLFGLGYRFNFGGQNYVALGVDYSGSSNSNGGLVGYDLDFQFYTEKLEFFGQLYFLDEYDDIHYAGLNYQFTTTLVAGVFVELVGNNSYFGGGLTWSPEKWIVDLMGFDHDWYGKTDLSVMYQVAQKFWLGIGSQNISNITDPYYSIKGKYDFASGQLRVAYRLANTNILGDAMLSLAYEMKLK